MIIALTGPKSAGKNYFADFTIKSNPNRMVSQIAFADPIKEDIISMFDLNSEIEYDEFKRVDVSFKINITGKTHQVSGRKIVRGYGMLKRSHNPDQFVDYVSNAINRFPQCTWIITDLRFANELDFLKKANATIIKIKRHGVMYDGHLTEMDFVDDEDCKYVITNDGSLNDYERSIRLLWEDFWEDKK